MVLSAAAVVEVVTTAVVEFEATAVEEELDVVGTTEEVVLLATTEVLVVEGGDEVELEFVDIDGVVLVEVVVPDAGATASKERSQYTNCVMACV